MEQVTTIGLDIAKHVFHAHGSDERGRAVFSRKLSRTKLLGFFAEQPRCVVALEACAGAHHWGRELMRLGHEVRLIPPAYVKPFVKRQKNDAADAEAICEAAQRPTMRFVAVKSEAQQASALVFRTRDLAVPGIGPVTATALLALAPAPAAFNRGRDFAAWLGLVPRQHSSGGKERLGAITRQGERTLRRLLILGASAVVRHAGSRGAPAGSWLAGMLQRKPRMLVTVALANKTARIVWAVMKKNESYRAPALAA
jgi:transposase